MRACRGTRNVLSLHLSCDYVSGTYINILAQQEPNAFSGKHSILLCSLV